MIRNFIILLVILVSCNSLAITKEEALRVKLDDRAMGDKKAPITLIEFSSVSCPHCADFHRNIFKKVKENYIDKGKVYYVYRSIPTNHPGLLGVMIMSCAKPEKFFDFLNTLMISQGMWAYHANYKESLINIAKLGGMQDKDIDACFANKTLEDSILKSALDDSAALGIDHTPTFYVNGEKLVGASKYEEIQKVIDSALQKTNSK